MSTSRREVLSALERESFDLLIIGGGITGAGIARDAALRGLKVALVDKGDFASGTSSKSSKLVHGGLRYLEYGELKLVFEGTNERALLLSLAPHLVAPQPFLVPSYKGDKPGLFVLDCGLWIYDALAKFNSPKLHRSYRRDPLLAIEPTLKREGLKGGVVYYDCTTDDSRMTIENLRDARASGALIANYVRVARIVREGEQVVGAELHDLESEGAPFLARARVIINATGPWSDGVRALDGQPPILAASKGIHVVVDSARLPVKHAIVMKQGQRVVFAIPWPGRTVIGTTDTFYEGVPEDVRAEADDVRYLLGLVGEYFPDAKLGFDDVLSTWAGLRPLIKPHSTVANASAVSREHLLDDRPGFITIAGGKLTTYRRMAKEAVDCACRQLSLAKVCTTETTPLGGADREARIAARCASDTSAGEKLDSELSYRFAEIDLAIEDEWACTLVDALERRVPLLLRARDQGLAVASRVASRMASQLSWDPARTTRELERFRAVVATTRRFRA